MEASVMLPSPPIDFNFDSSCTSPYISAPSTPPRFGTPFFSAPSSPSRFSSPASAATIFTSLPLNWHQNPHLPKSPQPNQNYENFENDQDFAFDFSGELDKHYLPADELFHGGKIKPFKIPHGSNSPKKSRDFDPFEEPFKNTTMQESPMSSNFQLQTKRKTTNLDHIPTPSSSRHHKTRSLSPIRVSDLLFDQQTEPHQNTQNSQNSNKTSSSSSSSSSSWYRKWKIKDLLLFRSASEGRPSSKAQLNKYSALRKQSNINKSNSISQEDEDVKNLSFRSVDSSVSSVGSSRRRSGLISAHELHYTINRAVSEEMKKKTFLPYKQGLLGCLGFQPANNDISRGVGLGSMSHAHA